MKMFCQCHQLASTCPFFQEGLDTEALSLEPGNSKGAHLNGVFHFPLRWGLHCLCETVGGPHLMSPSCTIVNRNLSELSSSGYCLPNFSKPMETFC